MRRIALIALPFLIAAPVIAQQMTKPGAQDSSRVTAGTYSVDPAHSMVGFEIDHLGFAPYQGLFGDMKGTLTLDPANVAATEIDVSVPISSILTTSAELTKKLPGPNWLNAAANPEARFVSTKVTRDRKDPNKAKVEGNLTLMGVTKLVSADVEFTGAGTNPFNKKAVIGFEAEVDIKRSDFGFKAGLPAIGDDVELEITAEFQK